MLELSGLAAIVGVVTGSLLLALFIGEALITWIIRAMHAGVKCADVTAAELAGKPATPSWLSVSVLACKEFEVLPGRLSPSLDYRPINIHPFTRRP